MGLGWVVPLVAAGLPIGAYMLLNPEKRTLDPAVRAELGGTYVGSPGRITHYSFEGPIDGPVIVLVHGGSVPMFTWDGIVPGLTAAGYRVLRYDMFGRGYSDRPGVVYDRDLYFQQLDGLLDALDVRGPVDLVGFSLGGATVATFAARRPERVRRLVLISPLGFGFSVPGVFKAPALGEFLLRIVGHGILEKRARALFSESPHADRYTGLFAEQKQYSGFSASLLSMFRNDALGDYRTEYSTIGGHDYPVSLVWGTGDTEVTGDVITTIRRLVPRAEYHGIEGVGHGIVFQRPDRVGRLITGFLHNDR